VDYRFIEANPAFERQAGVNLRGKWVTELHQISNGFGSRPTGASQRQEGRPTSKATQKRSDVGSMCVPFEWVLQWDSAGRSGSAEARSYDVEVKVFMSLSALIASMYLGLP
jgi:hypothetical protein